MVALSSILYVKDGFGKEVIEYESHSCAFTDVTQTKNKKKDYMLHNQVRV